MSVLERLRRTAADNVDWGAFLEAMIHHTGDAEFVEGRRADVRRVGGDKVHDEDDALRGDDLENGFGYLVSAAEEDLGLTRTVPQTQVAWSLYGQVADELGCADPRGGHRGHRLVSVVCAP